MRVTYDGETLQIAGGSKVFQYKPRTGDVRIWDGDGKLGEVSVNGHEVLTNLAHFIGDTPDFALRIEANSKALTIRLPNALLTIERWYENIYNCDFYFDMTRYHLNISLVREIINITFYANHINSEKGICTAQSRQMQAISYFLSKLNEAISKFKKIEKYLAV